MNAGAPTCPSCGGVSVHPQATHCRFCNAPLMPPAPPPGYAPPQQNYGYGAPPQQNYGAPQQNYGYGGPPPPYGGYPPAPNPYGVQPFVGTGPRYVQRSGWSSGWSTFFWVRLIIAGVAISISLLGACISALSH